MPIYEYSCEHNHIIEDIYAMGEAPANIKCSAHDTVCNRYFSFRRRSNR